MSKSKSKSKSKSLNFPDSYWDPGLEIYTYYPKFFEYYDQLKNIKLPEPAREGDALHAEIRELLRKQNDREERKRRRDDILQEATSLTVKYANALLVASASSPSTLPLMEAMNDISLIAVMHFKKQFSRPRPNQVEPAIEPMIPVPGHPAYPSGHSTQNFLIAHALAEVIGDDAELIARIFEIARGVAANREWAGVHYSSDTDAGEMLARHLFPIVREVFKDLIEDAIEEWQEFSDDSDHPATGAQTAGSATNAMAGSKGQVGGAETDLPWHLKNVGQNGGKPGVDIGIEEAWKKVDVDKNVRVVLLDMAVHLDHESLVENIDFQNALNLDYPDLPKKPSELCAGSVMGLLARESRIKSGEDTALLTEGEIQTRQYLDAFASRSSAHGTACAGVIVGSHKIAGSICRGVAPGCQLIPYRAMTRTEPTLKNRQFLARKVLEIPGKGLRQVLLCPLPFDPLPSGERPNGNGITTSNGSSMATTVDPLAFALAFVATKIPVIIPIGNDGTSELSPFSVQVAAFGHVGSISSVDELACMLGVDKSDLKSLLGIESDKDLTTLKTSLRPEESGVVSVGACNNKGYRSRYSQYDTSGNSGLVVAPSDDVLPPEMPAETDPEVRNEIKERAEKLGTLSIATTDGPGRSGYVEGDGKYTPSTNGYGFGGTSAAAAQVAGIVALMLSANGNLTPSEVRHGLQISASLEPLVLDTKPNENGIHQELGYGLVNATAAIEFASKKKK